MDISVIVCTFNRSRSLETTLTSLLESTLPQRLEWEVVVVDNNSSDNTREMVSRFAARHPRVRYATEAKQGKSYALNTGVRLARGDILAFTDDDVVVDATWLQTLTQPLHDKRWSMSSGPVLPVWTSPSPSWIPLHAEYGLAPLAHFDRGTQAGPIAECPFGCNMATRRSMFAKYGDFRVDLGPSTPSDCSLWHSDLPPRTSEDSEFCQRLIDGGETVYYEPAAVVHHVVTGDRLRKEYFLGWWFEKGRGDARQYGAKAGTRIYFRRVPVYLVGGLALRTVKWIAAIQPQRRFQNKLSVWKQAGEMLEFYRGRARLEARSSARQP